MSYEYYWAVAEAFELHLKLGKGRIQRHTRRLARRLKIGLDDLHGISLVTPLPSQLSSGIVCCDVGGVSPEQAVKRLRSEHKILASASSRDAQGRVHLRFSPSILNTGEEIDNTLDAVAKLASRTSA